MLTAALVTAGKKEKQPKCLLTSERIKKSGMFIHEHAVLPLK